MFPLYDRGPVVGPMQHANRFHVHQPDDDSCRLATLQFAIRATGRPLPNEHDLNSIMESRERDRALRGLRLGLDRLGIPHTIHPNPTLTTLRESLGRGSIAIIGCQWWSDGDTHIRDRIVSIPNRMAKVTPDLDLGHFCAVVGISPHSAYIDDPDTPNRSIDGLPVGLRRVSHSTLFHRWVDWDDPGLHPERLALEIPLKALPARPLLPAPTPQTPLQFVQAYLTALLFSHEWIKKGRTTY